MMTLKTVLAVQVPILDPQIHMKPGYAPYDQGIAQGVFIRDMTGQPYIGQACIAHPIPKKSVLQVQACELEVAQAITAHRGRGKRRVCKFKELSFRLAIWRPWQTEQHLAMHAV